MKERIIPVGRAPTAHTWQECYPVVYNPNAGLDEVDLNNDVNRAVRKIFSKLSQLERIKFHQFTCQCRHSPSHFAVVEKIEAKLKDAGLPL